MILKNDIRNYLRQLTKTLSFCYLWNTTHRLSNVLQMRLIWVGECLCQRYNFFRYKMFVLLDKISKIYKTVWNQRHKLLCYKCYIYIQSVKDDHLKSLKFNFRHNFSFSWYRKYNYTWSMICINSNMELLSGKYH